MVVMLDGVHIAERGILMAVGIHSDGKKQEARVYLPVGVHARQKMLDWVVEVEHCERAVNAMAMARGYVLS